jgi:hypothetical protein
MFIQGKYSATEKMERLNRFWSTGNHGLPEEDRLNQFGRETIDKWRMEGLGGARRALRDYLHQVQNDPGASGAAAEWRRLLAQNPTRLTTLIEDLIAAVQLKGLGSIRLDGVAPEIVGDLWGRLKDGMLKALAYTNDRGEVPSIEILNERAGPFPTGYIQPEHKTALCIFTTNHFGVQDVIHVHKAGIQHATLVDIDSEMLSKMKHPYPTHWSFIASDFRDYLRSAVADGRKFDVVTSDQPYELCDEVTTHWLGALLQLTGHILFVFIPERLLRQAGYDGNGTEQLEATLSKRAGVPAKVLQVMHRNRDVYWVVLRVD